MFLEGRQLRGRDLEDQILVEMRESVRRIKTAEKRIEATGRAAALARHRRVTGMLLAHHEILVESNLAPRQPVR